MACIHGAGGTDTSCQAQRFGVLWGDECVRVCCAATRWQWIPVGVWVWWEDGSCPTRVGQLGFQAAAKFGQLGFQAAAAFLLRQTGVGLDWTN
jgi:hypothetical protein